MSQPTLSLACLCGRSASAPCPTVADIPHTQIDGWSFDKRGMVRCQECLETGETKPAQRSRDTHQAELFGAVA